MTRTGDEPDAAALIGSEPVRAAQADEHIGQRFQEILRGLPEQLEFGPLGVGWEGAERALAAVQADLSRTVANAPTLVLAWHELESNDHDVAGPAASTEQWACVGTSRDGHFSATARFLLPREYVSAVVEIATAISDAMADTLLGHYAYWPHCPADDHLLTVQVDAHQRCWWYCQDRDHPVAEIGHLQVSSPKGD